MSPTDKKVLSLLGLAQRGRNLVSGEQQVLQAIRDGSAYLVLVADDASENSQKLFRDKSSYYDVPFFTIASKEEIGHALGKELRSSLAVVEPGFAKKIIALLEDEVRG